VGKSGSPRFTPLSILNSAVYALFNCTFAVAFTRENLINLEGSFFWVKESNILFRSVESIVCVKWMLKISNNSGKKYGMVLITHERCTERRKLPRYSNVMTVENL
jgi:hypothetical protein